MQLFCVIFLHPLHRNSFRAKKKLKKSVKKFASYCFLYYLYTIRKIKKVITIKNKNKMKNLVETLKNEAINTFIIETLLIDPINDIIFKLKNKGFRDCDIRWLNDKLYKYTAVAAETMGIKFPEIELISNDGVLNDYTTARFIEAFTTLLNYFKSF